MIRSGIYTLSINAFFFHHMILVLSQLNLLHHNLIEGLVSVACNECDDYDDYTLVYE
jgi:hypothetical protein